LRQALTILLTLTLTGVFSLLKAQVFPVQINTQVLPPYSSYLTDYTTPGAQKFVVQLRVNDPTISEYRCKLRITIEGVGITIRTRPSFIPQPLVLEGGGIPQIFYGEDLSDYFNPNNLDFAGISRSEYSRNAKLPEGVYRFSVEVLDYNRNTVVSTKTTTIAWIILNDPPLLNLPRNDFKVQITDPLNLPFNWTPRHKGSPNAAFTTEYIFRLVEIWPLNRNPYDAFLSQQPLYEITTSDQQILYGPAEPSLIPGRKYAWQVQAIDTEGRDLFKNQGRSEVYVFQFGDEIGVPENLRKEAANASNITVRWEPAATGEMPEKYRIRYKPATTTTWYETTNQQSWATLPELKSNTAYDVQVRGEKGKRFGAFSSSQRFSTAAVNPDTGFTCGQPANITRPSGSNLLFALAPGDIFSCNDFRIVVTEITSASNGVYSGKGLAQVKMLNGASIEVTFAGSINNEYQLTTGDVRSTYDQGSKIGVVIDNIYKIGEGNQDPAKQQSDTTFAAPPITYIVPGRIDRVYLDEEGTIVVINDKGEQSTYQQPVLDSASNKKQDVILTDTHGNTYTVSNGKVTNNGTTAANAVASAVNYSVTFDGTANQQFGFDKQQHAQLEKYYDHQTIKGLKYLIPWKAVAIGSFDNVKASASAKRPDFVKEIGFRSTIGALPKTPGTDSEALLTVQGRVHQQVEEIEAYLTKKDSAGNNNEEVIGRLNVISYNKIYRTLVLVPVNGTTLHNNIDAGQIQRELNKIYGQAAVQWLVQMASTFSSNYDDDEDGLEFGNSGIFSNYTKEMRTIINGYTKNTRFLDDTYYLFLVPKASDKHATGFMPRKKQAGFIFTEQLGSGNPIKTIAHELAHGAFRLEHTFPELPENGNNLLDYSATGTYLHKYQWDLVHDPVAVLGLFEGDEAGASRWVLIDEKHTRLFNHIYDNHKYDDQTYLIKIDAAKASDVQALDLDYSGPDADWVKSWKLRVIDFKTALEDELHRIKETQKGEKISQVSVKPKHIYLGQYEHEGTVYPIAIYGNGSVQDMANLLTKVEVTDVDGLDDAENKKWIYVEETFTKYFIIALYEENRVEPSFIIQVEKFAGHNSMEKWLRYLGILKDAEPIAIELTEEIVETENSESEEEEISDNPATARALFAREKDLTDTRLYKTPVYVPEKLTDEFVDCAEFTNEVTLSQGTDIGYGSDGQLEWCKKNGQYGTSANDIKVGDIIFWDRTYKTCTDTEKTEEGKCTCEKKSKQLWYKNVSSPDDIDHVGIVVEYNDVTKTGKVVHSSVQGNVNPSINEVALAANGNIYDGSCDQMTFIAWGRVEKE
jgi:hypothetical protein